MKLSPCILLVTLASGCADIPDPGARPAWDAGAPPDAALGDGGYAGPCRVYGAGISRGVMPTSLRAAARGDGVAIQTLFRFAIPEVDEINRIELFTVGVPGELRGAVTDLGAGINAELSTCVHCVLVYRQCAMDGYDCALGPYFPRSGRAVSPQVADAVGAASSIQLANVELVRVDIAADGSTVAVSGDEDCVHFEAMTLSNTVTAAPAACDDGYHCQLADTASQRHPE
jgi:hypothetical protein